jgi:predicted neuraminidase
MVILAWITMGSSSTHSVMADGLERGHLAVGGQTRAWLPNLAKLDDGTILCAYVQGTAPRLDSIWITATRDTGRRWADPVRVMQSRRDGYIADPNVLVTGGRIRLYATFVPDTQPPYSRSETWMSESTDGGKRWSDPKIVPIPRKYVSGKVHVPIRLRDGAILMGYSWETGAEQGKASGTEGNMVTKCGVLRSTDGGEHWRADGDVSVSEPMGADEPALVELTDGGVFMIARTGGRQPYEAISRDGGLSWTDLKPSRFVGHNSPSALLRLADGAILRVWDHSTTNRYPLVASVSTDECRTWSSPKTITEPTRNEQGGLSYQTACYPSIAQADDGSILVVWWETGPFGSRIGFARFPPSWPRP